MRNMEVEGRGKRKKRKRWKEGLERKQGQNVEGRWNEGESEKGKKGVEVNKKQIHKRLEESGKHATGLGWGKQMRKEKERKDKTEK